jgi:hypothetical protein
VVEHLPHHPKVKGSNPDDAGSERMAENFRERRSSFQIHFLKTLCCLLLKHHCRHHHGVSTFQREKEGGCY